MKKYIVYFEFKYAKREETHSLEIEAPNKKEAFKKAQEMANQKCHRHAFHCRLKERRW